MLGIGVLPSRLTLPTFLFSRRQNFRPSPQEHGGRGVWGEFRRALAKNRGQPRRLLC